MANNPKKIFGLIGYPVKHSLSPAMHNAAFSYLKIDAEYRLFEVKPQESEDFLDIDNLTKRNIYGLNVTIPHKIRAREILERKFPFEQKVAQLLQDLYYVKLSGAINTIKREGNILRYYNTDAEGFLNSLEEDLGFKTQDKNVLVIGCGGAGRAVIAALSWKNVGIKKIYLTDINDQAMNSAKGHFSNIPQATYLSDKLKFIPSEEVAEVIKDCDLLVNATPVGMKDDDGSVIAKSLLHKNLCVYDVVYNRNQKTNLIKDAESLGRPAVGGLRMLWRQGMRSFELWTAQKAPEQIMMQALKENLEICQSR